MTKALKIGIGVLVFLIIGYMGLSRYVNYRITKFLENDLLTTAVSIEDVSTNLFTGSASIHGINTTPDNAAASRVGLFEISGLSYYQILFKNHIAIDLVHMSDFEIFFPLQQQKDSTKSKEYKITLHQIDLNKGKVARSKKDTISFKVDGLMTQVKDVTFNTARVAKSLSYEIHNIKADSSFLKMNASEDLKTAQITIQSKEAQFKNLRIQTNFETSKQIKDEKINKDQLSLETTQLSISDYNLSFYPKWSFKASMMRIDSTSFSIMANNNTERTEVKTSYSKQLRNLGVQLKIDTIKVSEAGISYSEPNKAATQRGAITFENINATFSNFNNIEGSGAITAQTTSSFMGSRNLKTNFSLNPYDENDAFEWSGELKNFDLTAVNSFLNPVLDMKLKGKVHQYYFSLYGNKTKHTADIKINFDNVQMEFTKEKLGINALISDLANLVATNDSDNQLISKSVSLDRNNKASFFNQAWRVQRKALLEVVK